MKITSVEPQKSTLRLRSGSTRYNIFLDGQFAFGADEDTVVKFRLVLGKEINPENLDKILLETEVGKLMGRMYGLFQIRQRSEKEIRDYLRNLNFKKKVKDLEQIPDVVIESLIQNLINKGLLNDEAFARAWVESMRNSKKKGKIAIKMELIGKGIDRETIEQIMSDVSIVDDEEKIAEEALLKKLKAFKNLPEMEFRKKATEFLMRKGFEYSVAKIVVAKYLKKE